MLNLTNEDCMDLMARYPDNYFNLAITDPPYGIDAANDSRNGRKFKASVARRKDYQKKDWDKDVPEEAYFRELFRVSKDQIIWGVNYYPYDFLAGGRIFWDKETAEDYTNSDGELAFCSKINSIKKFKFMWNGMLQGDMKNKEIRIHQTQKPVQLYKWLLMKFAKPGDHVLDTHLGSASIAIAVDNVNKIDKMNLTLTGCEKDAEIYADAIKRVKEQTTYLTLF